MGLVLIVAVIGLLFIPAVFQFAVGKAIALETWRRGGTVRIEQVQGSFFEPVALLRSQWTYRSRHGAATRVEIARAEAEFSWRELLPGRGAHWFRRLSLEGLAGKVLVPVNPKQRVRGEGGPAHRGPFPSWLQTPARVEAKGVDLVFQSENDYVRLQDARWMISELEQGFIEVGQLVLKQPWLTRSFRSVRGNTALQDGKVVVANLQLDPGVLVKSFSIGLNEMANGGLDMVMDVGAFGGSIRAQAQTSPPDDAPEFDAIVNFSQIQLAPLAAFLGASDAAGGTVKEGRFTFRGSPREPERAAATLRLEATNFQWESRQWDSLVLGAVLLDRRVQIPELELRQGHNNLSLNGEMALPFGAGAKGRAWWQNDFNFSLLARIENLTELSALLLPEFKYAAGSVSIDGNVRAKDQQFSGNLIVAGTNVSWRNTPIQELHGAVRLAGSEVQIASLDLLNKDDYLHGQGVVTLGAGKAGAGFLRGYRADVRASVEDLGEYSALLPWQRLSGGAVLRWTGQGGDKGDSGRFFARLQKLRPVHAGVTLPHPVDAELEGSYEPGKTILSRFNLADEECALTATAQLIGQSLQVSGLRLTHGAQTWLEGDALLPLDVLKNWPAPAPKAPGPEVPVKLSLKATGLSLKHAVRLTGWNWPVEGFVEGALTAEGALGKLALGGRATLQSGRIPIGWQGEHLSAVHAEISGAAQTLSVTKGSGEHRHGAYTGALQVDLTKYWDPVISADLTCERAWFPIFQQLPLTVLKEGLATAPANPWCEAAVHLQIAGPLSAAPVQGDLRLLGLSMGGTPVLTPLWLRNAPAAQLPQPFTVPIFPFKNWPLKLSVKHAEPVPMVPAGTILPDLEIRGVAGAPKLAGTVRLAGAPAQASASVLEIKDLLLTFREDRPNDPMIDLHAAGIHQGFPFNAYILGPLSQHMAFADSPEALAEFREPKPLDPNTPILPLLEATPLGGAKVPGAKPNARP